MMEYAIDVDLLAHSGRLDRDSIIVVRGAMVQDHDSWQHNHCARTAWNRDVLNQPCISTTYARWLTDQT